MSTATSPGTIAITGVRVFDGHQTAEDQTVIITGELIASVGPRQATSIPAGASVIDGTGRTLLPGFIDMHTHVTASALPLFLAYGVTTVKDVGNTYERVLPARDAEHRGEALPRVYCCGPLVDGDPPFWPDHSYALASDADAQAAADDLAAHHVDACKAYMMLPVAQMRAFVSRALEHGLSTSAHLGHVSASEAMDAGVAGFEHTAQSFYTEVVREELVWHADERRRRGLGAFWANFVRGWADVDLTSRRVGRICERAAGAGVYVDPTLVTLQRTVARGERGIDALDADPVMSEYAASERAGWRATHDRFFAEWSSNDYAAARRALEKVQGFTALLHRTGVRIHASTDAPFAYILPGSSYYTELELLNEAGLSAEQALACGTSVPASTLGADDIGVIAPGRRADLLLVLGDPTLSIGALRGLERVFKGGRELDRTDLLQRARDGAPAAH